MQTIGIPRALLYYRYGEFWQKFLSELGFAVRVSRPTSEETLARGLGKVSSEVCLPVKITAGHIEELKNSVDYLFLPRMVWLRDELYACPKMIGISDLARVTVRGACRVIAPTIKGDFMLPHLRAGLQLTGNPVKTWQAWKAARDLLNRHTTIPEHMPSAHRRYAEWTPQRIMREAASIGPAAIALVEAIMKAKPHPEQGFRLPGHHQPGEDLRVRARRGREPARQRHRRNHLRLDQVDPAERSRQSLRQLESAGRPADPARQHPWSWLLPLTHWMQVKEPRG